jgi:hypothetical protein
MISEFLPDLERASTMRLFSLFNARPICIPSSVADLGTELSV